MNEKFLGNIFNLLLLGAFCVYCVFYSRQKPDADDLRVFVEILIYLGIFLAARLGAALLHQLGHVIFAVFAGFEILYFEWFIFKLWHDGDRVRFGLFFDVNALFSGSVMIKLKNTFDTAVNFKKNHVKYSKFLLGGFIFNVAGIAAAIIIYAACLPMSAVFSPLCLCALAVMLGCWFMAFNAFDDSQGKRGDFIAFTKSRDSESLVVSLAAQSIVEGIDHAFLFREAQSVIAFKMKNGLPWLDRPSMNALSAIAFYACAGRAEFSRDIETYLNEEFFKLVITDEKETSDTTEQKPDATERDKKIFLAAKIKNFVAYYALYYGRERALEVLNLGAEAFTQLRLRDNSLFIYYADTRAMLKETLSTDEQEVLSYTKFMSADSYAMGFKNFREINDLAEDNVHQAIYAWHEQAE